MKALGLSVVLSIGVAACAAEEVDPAPTRTTSLSLTYQNRCAVCHGARGEGISRVPAIPGKLDEVAFKAAVRAGRGVNMPSYPPAEVSDADLERDYRALSQQAGR
ncbi:MAG: cytochrome c [Deltaproteobacteria bacterium]|nr:cytochrome c [Deltaproteobacteria bacterium]